MEALIVSNNRPLSENEEIKRLGFDDSKQLKEGERDKLFEVIRSHPSVGWVIEELTAVHISEVLFVFCKILFPYLLY